MTHAVLALNAGSSTLKFSIFRFEAGTETELGAGNLEVSDGNDAALLERVLADAERLAGAPPDAVGHRIVHGGEQFTAPVRVDEDVLGRLATLSELAPLHLPPALALLRKALERLPRVPHVACFDTAFHHRLPEVARRFALPNALYERGIHRYGFHGLSCEYVLSVLGSPPPRRLIIAHLGSGASLTAVLDGRSIDTSMGLTPAGGIAMGTRSGDLDPGILLQLLRERTHTVDELTELIHHDSGLKGVTGDSSMSKLLARAEHGDAPAKMGIELFAYGVKKQIGAYIAALGGLDCLVFTAGIGEHAPLVRARVLEGLSWLGIELDVEANDSGASVISRKSSRVVVRVLPTNEDLVIARAAYAVLPAALQANAIR
ncbi:MAG: acetate/propionate family kinase [Myxococcales bacterium]